MIDWILTDIFLKSNFSDEAINNLQHDVDRVYFLERRIVALEDELDNKDIIILKPMNVIVVLVNSFKNVIFNGMQFMHPFV